VLSVTTGNKVVISLGDVFVRKCIIWSKKSYKKWEFNKYSYLFS